MNLLCIRNGRLAALLVVLAAVSLPQSASAEVVTLRELEELALQNQARWEAVEATAAQASAEVRAARVTRRIPLSSPVAPRTRPEPTKGVNPRSVARSRTGTSHINPATAAKLS